MRHFIKVIDKELYIGGPEGLYILGNKERYIPTEGVSGTYINDVIKTEDNKIWVFGWEAINVRKWEAFNASLYEPGSYI